MFNSVRLAGLAAILAVSAFGFATPQASAMSMADCSAMYQKAKADGTLNGMKWNDFRKAKCSADAASAPAATTTSNAKANGAAAQTGAAATGTGAAASNDAGFLKSCSESWKAWKKAGNRPADMKFSEFVANKCVVPGANQATAPAAPAAPVTPAPKITTATKVTTPTTPAAGTTMVDKNGKPMSAGLAAMVTRERACAAEWHKVKGTNQVAAGTTWPQFWHDCNTKMKAAGQ